MNLPKNLSDFGNYRYILIFFSENVFKICILSPGATILKISKLNLEERDGHPGIDITSYNLILTSVLARPIVTDETYLCV